MESNIINGYQYQTENEAIAARNAAAKYWHLPHDQTDVTRYWVNYQYSELDGFWYIQYVEGLENVLGKPYEFKVQIPEDI